jgi:hypothetical protein
MRDFVNKKNTHMRDDPFHCKKIEMIICNLKPLKLSKDDMIRIWKKGKIKVS